MPSYTVSEARERLSEVLDEAESGPIEITRRGRPAAVVLSQQEYRRLSGKTGLMAANNDFPSPQRSAARDISTFCGG